MEIRQLEYILAIVKADYNLTRAAEILNISQAALSKMVTGLEHEMDAKFFVREKGRLVGITAVGQIVLSHAGILVAGHQRMMEDISFYSKKLIGRVRVGISTSILQVLFSDALPHIILANPGIHFEIIEESTSILEKQFFMKDLDILVTLMHNNSRPRHYSTAVLASEPFVAIMGINHPLTKHKRLAWKQLDGVKLALPPQGYLTHSIVSGRMGKEGLLPHIVIETSAADVLIKATTKNDVVTILPKVFYDNLVCANEPAVWLPFSEEVYWNVEMLMNQKHAEKKDHVFHVFGQMRDALLAR